MHISISVIQNVQKDHIVYLEVEELEQISFF